MSDENKENQIQMNDNSENTENIPPEAAEGKKQGEAWYSKPEQMGNVAGEKIQSTLSPVSNATGPVFEKGAGVIGGAVDPLVGGVMRAGKGWGEQLGVGYGNAEGGPAKAQEAEHQRMKEPLGGKEQTGDNPLGL